MSSDPVLKIANLTKRFPGTLANDAISLEINAGEILSIVGENGAGKSTFCKMLTGVYHPDEGQIFLNGKEVKIDSPIQSMKLGITMVYQERNLVRGMTVAENVCLGHEPTKTGLIDNKEMEHEAEEIRDKLGLSVPVDAVVSTLGAGEQQLVEIMRAFYVNPSVIILDEPTASLSEKEAGAFLEFVTRIKKKLNLAVIFISHKMDEVFNISDKIAVFTDGRCVLCEEAEKLTIDQCISAMLRNHSISELDIKEHVQTGDRVLDVKSIHYDGKKQNVQFHVDRGEIVGFYGLVGAGRTECMEAIYGIRRYDSMDVDLSGEKLPMKQTPMQMIERGMIMTPERRGNGIFKTFSLTKNIDTLFLRKKLVNSVGLIKFSKAREFAKEVLDENGVKYKSQEQMITELSGGNIQKVIIGRSLKVENVKLLVLDEPTAGMDVGAKYEVYQKTLDAANKQNLGVVFISSELDELLAICNRIYVFADGDVFDEVSRDEFDKERILGGAMRRVHEKVG